MSAATLPGDRSRGLSMRWRFLVPLIVAILLVDGFPLAYALVGLWLGWRVARGLWSLQKSRPLPTDVRL